MDTFPPQKIRKFRKNLIQKFGEKFTTKQILLTSLSPVKRNYEFGKKEINRLGSYNKI